MIKVTPSAAAQIQVSVKETDSEDLLLRLAVSKNTDGSLHYGFGFDEKKENDLEVSSESITIIYSPLSAELINDTVIDYVEIEPENYQFIFLNPNDPTYKPPSES